MIECSDGTLYVVKAYNNPQGPNVLTNGVIGSTLLHAAGLPTPAWKPIYLSNRYIEQSPHPSFLSHRLGDDWGAGFHFGSRFIQSQSSAGCSIESHYPLLSIRSQFFCLGVYIFDVWANHCDRREILLLQRCETSLRDVLFIDNGHLFGGPSWSRPSLRGQALCLNVAVYPSWSRADINWWVAHLKAAMAIALKSCSNLVPRIWLNGSLKPLIDVLFDRLDMLSKLVEGELSLNTLD